MRLALFGLALLACLAAAAVAEPTMETRPLTNEELIEYQSFLLDQQAQGLGDSDIAYDISQAPAVQQCPIHTRALSIPPKHVKFWKTLPLTSQLTWVGAHRYLCVPSALRMKLTPIIQKLKVREVVAIDPTTNTKLMKEIQKIAVGLESPEEEVVPVTTVPVTEGEIATLLARRELEDDMLAAGVSPREFSAAGRMLPWGWGRGFGGWGYGGLGYGGLGYGGLGYGGLGYGGWGYPGFGWGGYGAWGYPGFGFGFAV